MVDVGRKVRESRVLAGLTIAQVAERTGFSSSYISQLERGLCAPSLSALSRISKAVGLNLSTFFSDNGSPVNGPQPTQVDMLPTRLIRHDNRKALVYPKARLDYELLVPDVQHAMQVHSFRAHVGVSMTEEEATTHPGEECTIVLRGQMEFVVGDDSYTMGPGDSLYFAGGKPHYWKNIGQEELEVIGIIVPPHF